MPDNQRSHERLDSGQPLKLPDELLLDVRKSVEGMMPSEFAFALPGTVVIDNPTGRILLDTADPLAPLINRISLRETHPALLRIFANLGGVATHGYIVDLRYILKPKLVFRSKDSDGNHLIIEEEPQWTDFRTVNPMGVLLADREISKYFGEIELETTAKQFAKSMDTYYQHLSTARSPEDSYDAALEAFTNEENVVELTD